MGFGQRARRDSLPTARHFFIVTCTSVFLAEILVMLLLSLLEIRISVPLRAVLDAFLLMGLLIPVLYFFLYRPLYAYIQEVMILEEKVLREVGISRIKGGPLAKRETEAPSPAPGHKAIKTGSL